LKLSFQAGKILIPALTPINIITEIFHKSVNFKIGIIWVDYEPQQHILKDTTIWYQKVIQLNGLDKLVFG
jgi:beta-glucosidase/6-phospho-beta-glucosidase/beta-galactosidase